MANSPDFVAHALDLLAGLGPLSARSMFGGHGIYYQGIMFALLDDDELFLKADDEARRHFEAADCRQWAYPSPNGPVSMGYWRPPDEAHEEAEAMLPWARLAVEAALRKAAAKAARGTRPAKPAAAKPASGRPKVAKRQAAKARTAKPAGAKPKAAKRRTPARKGAAPRKRPAGTSARRSKRRQSRR